jgi:uncharacterized protein (TIGR03382 family)
LLSLSLLALHLALCAKQIGERGVDEGQFSKPTAVAITSSGHLFVADTGNQRCQVLCDATGGALVALVVITACDAAHVYTDAGAAVGVLLMVGGGRRRRFV